MKKAVLFLCLIAVLLLCSCSAGSKGGSLSPAGLEESIAEIFEENANVPDTENDAGDRVAELIYSKATYKVEEYDGRSCTVEVSSPDIKELFYSCYSEDTQQTNDPDALEAEVEALTKKLEQELNDGNYTMKSTSVVVPVKNGKVENTFELTDAIYGGLLSLKDELVAENNEGKEG